MLLDCTLTMIYIVADKFYVDWQGNYISLPIVADSVAECYFMLQARLAYLSR
jgi:hypothetical protein